MLPMIAACSGSDQGNSERRVIAENFSELVSTALGDPNLQEFDREVLERAERTGRIEQADYDEAYSRFAQCMETSGEPVNLTKLSNGLYRVENAPLSDGETIESAMSTVTTCSEGTISRLGELYSIQQGNPELLANPYEIAYKCLESKGLVDSDLPLEEFQKAFRSEGDGESSLEERMPFDPYGDEAQACFAGANMSIGKAS
ncbi:hypothetical protein ACIQF8_09540 [Pseudarthrobacter sp. NPDC092184]|uniref:hypothetical protein n=1 Tax=Pseudarthrobacter sp. NPDC092184 TaxID=3364410 RepID=UPI003814C165